MAQTNFTPILLYASSTVAAIPSAGNLTNSATGSELAINIADKNLFFKDSTGVVNTVPIRQSGTSSNGWLSATDWNTFNSKAPATSGATILYGNGSGGFSNVTIGTGISFAGGTLSATGSGGTVTSVTGTAPVVSSGGTAPAISMAAATSSVNGYLTSTDWTTFNNKGNGTVTSVAALTLGTTGTDLSSSVATGTTTPVITLNVPTASAANRGALSSTDWSTFNSKQAALISGTNIKTVSGVSLLGSGDVGTIGTAYGGTGLATFTANGIFYASSTSVIAQSAGLTFNGTNFATTGRINAGANIVAGDGSAFVFGTGTTAYISGSSASNSIQIFNNSAEVARFSSNRRVGLFANSEQFGLQLNYAATQNGCYLGSTGADIFTICSSGGTERVRLDASGNWLVNTTAQLGAGKICVAFNGSTQDGIAIKETAGTGGAYMVRFLNSSGTIIGTISNNANTGILYNVTSDYRLKDNTLPLTGASNFIMALQPKAWDWRDGSGKGVGFIAHEFMEVAKHSGNGVKDAVDAEGKPVYQSVQPSSSEVIANLVALAQEQQALIADLKTRLTVLEAK